MLMLRLLTVSFGLALISIAALFFTVAQSAQPPELPKFDPDEQIADAAQKFTLDDHRAAINHFHIATEVLKERCRERTDMPATCLAKGEVALLDRVRKACEDAKGDADLCGEITDAKRY